MMRVGVRIDFCRHSAHPAVGKERHRMCKTQSSPGQLWDLVMPGSGSPGTTKV
jgi:hypothetical protein